jgi:NTP-dependent ternary system trypsin peptidase co-occuring protein
MAVELAELITQLRADLVEAMRTGAGSELRFELGPVELELTIALEKSGGAAGKVRFWVVEGGVDGRAAATTTQRIKLTLDPRRADQPGSRPFVNGDAEPGER